MTTASFRLQLHPAQQEQIDPEHGHEVPVNGRVLKKRAAKRGMAGRKTTGEIDESGDTGKHMKRMDKSQQIEERAVGTGGQVDALRAQIAPGGKLAKAKGQAEKERQKDPSAGPVRAARRERRGGSQRAAGHLKSGAAREQNRRIKVKYSRQNDVGPIRRAFADEKRAAEGSKTHGNGKEPNPDAAARGAVLPRREDNGVALRLVECGRMWVRRCSNRERHNLLVPRSRHAARGLGVSAPHPPPLQSPLTMTCSGESCITKSPFEPLTPYW